MALKTLKSAFFEERKKAKKADVVDEIDATAQAEEVVARRTRELLSTRGWCLWKSSTLDDETIAVVLDENVEGVPERYPSYTEAELLQLCRDGVSEATIHLVHEAKKLAGAKVTTEVTK